MVVTLIFTVVDIAAFGFMATKQYLLLSNASSALSVYFHCTSWCVTSLVRYIYIEHEEWIHALIPSTKKQAITAVCLILIASTLCIFPLFGYAVTLGKMYVTELSLTTYT